MRKQIAAANWKMNLTIQEGKELLDSILPATKDLKGNQEVIFAVPAPYLSMAVNKIEGLQQVFIAAQNMYTQKNGAFTGETSAEMLQSIGVTHVLVGHSERREYFAEDHQTLAEKVNRALEYQLTPVFCCGEPLKVREAENQNVFVAKQLEESLFHLDAASIEKVIIAYEPIWAIGTGKTASTEQTQEMHAFLRRVLEEKYGAELASRISILYGGSVKAANAVELFRSKDVDGGLVGGASLVAKEFDAIIKALH